MIKKYFAKLDENNIVTAVDVVNLEDNASEEDGINFLKNFYNEPNSVWKMTDKKTKLNVHSDGGTPFRGNFAVVGGSWDNVNNVFWTLKPYNSYLKDNSNYGWKAPVEYPSITQNADEHLYFIFWNEENIRWHADLYSVTNPDYNENGPDTRPYLKSETVYYWNPDNSTWNEI